MEQKRKIKRILILTAFIYIIINGFVWGFMKAYINSHNIVSNEQLAMATITKESGQTNIKILNKDFSINKKNKALNKIEIIIYILLPDKARTATEIIMQIDNHFQ